MFGSGAGSSVAASSGLFGQQQQQPPGPQMSAGMFGVTANQAGATGWGVFGQQPGASPPASAAPALPGNTGKMAWGAGAGKKPATPGLSGGVSMWGMSASPVAPPAAQPPVFGQQPQVQNPFAAAAPSSTGGFGFGAQQPAQQPFGGSPVGGGFPVASLGAPVPGGPSAPMSLTSTSQASMSTSFIQQSAGNGMATSADAGSDASPYQAPTFRRGKVRQHVP
jgi:hypothetical protein